MELASLIIIREEDVGRPSEPRFAKSSQSRGKIQARRGSGKDFENDGIRDNKEDIKMANGKVTRKIELGKRG
jgi:hypothetical protein